MKLKKENNICFKIIQFKYIENVKKNKNCVEEAKYLLCSFFFSWSNLIFWLTVILLQQQRWTLKKSIENVRKTKTVQLKCIVCCK